MQYALLDDDAARRAMLSRTLRNNDVVICFDGELKAIDKARSLAGSLIVVGQVPELTLFLDKVETPMPMVMAIPQGELGDLIPLVRGSVYGLVTFSQGLAALSEMLRSVETDLQSRGPRLSGADAARRGLLMLRQAQASGLLQVESDKASGQILLQAGRVVDAECGAMRGEDAAASLVAGLGAKPRLSWSGLEQASIPAPLEQGFELTALDGTVLPELSQEMMQGLGPIRVLLADDDEAIRNMLAKTLQHRGFQVTSVEDGQEGAESVQQNRPDLILSDIMMPKLDGWGFLSQVRNDHRIRETPFALLSCHHGYLDHLKQLDAGADAYMPKGVKLDEIVEKLLKLALPRLRLLAAIDPQSSLRGRFARLGPISILRAFAHRNATGFLTVDDRWAKYRVSFAAGVVANVSARVGTTVFTDQAALRSLIGVRRGSWTFESGVEPDQWTLQRPALELIEEIAGQASRQEAQIREHMMTGSSGLVANGDMLTFYEQVCPTSLQPIVALVKQGTPPRDILADGNISPLIVDWLFKDMVNKGVVRFGELG